VTGMTNAVNHLLRSVPVDFGSLTGSLPAAAALKAGVPLAAARAGTWLPEAAAAHAADVDRPFLGLYLASVFAVVLVTGLAVIFVMQYRRRDESARGAAAGRPNPVLLGVWLLASVALAAWAFGSGFGGFLDRSVAPYGAYAIDVTARQWDYDFVYPNGYVADTLHVAVGRPVQLNLVSEDVVHGLSVPALRVNSAILPGRISRTWFEADAADTFTLRSDIYSGDGYSDMRTVLISQSQAEFDAWLTRVSDIFSGRTYEEVGELLYTTKGCVACHSIDGSKRVGPSFKELYGHEFETREGERITADDAYIKQSILEPNASIVAGYEPVMTPYAGQITDREIEAITAWLKTLSSLGGTGEAEAAENPEAPEDPADAEQKENE
jgi:cytochrome c oxidase subunit 2